MTKTNLSQLLSESGLREFKCNNCGKTISASMALKRFFELIVEEAIKGNKISLFGFGTFSLRTWVNENSLSKTDKTISSLRFSASRVVREKIRRCIMAKRQRMAMPKCPECGKALFKTKKAGEKIGKDDLHRFCRNKICSLLGVDQTQPVTKQKNEKKEGEQKVQKNEVNNEKKVNKSELTAAEIALLECYD